MPGLLDYVNVGLQGATQLFNLFNQKEQWKREDNAIQRRVEDLKKAGLSPVLAAGSAAQAGPAVRLSAPQFSSDVEAQGAGIAQTKAQTALTHLEMQRKDNENLIPSLITDMLRKDATVAGRLSYDLTKSTIERMISDQKRMDMENKEYARNIGIFRHYEVPSSNAPAAGEIANVEMMKQAFPEIFDKATGGNDSRAAFFLRMLNIIGGGRR